MTDRLDTMWTVSRFDKITREYRHTIKIHDYINVASNYWHFSFYFGTDNIATRMKLTDFVKSPSCTPWGYYNGDSTRSYPTHGVHFNLHNNSAGREANLKGFLDALVLEGYISEVIRKDIMELQVCAANARQQAAEEDRRAAITSSARPGVTSASALAATPAEIPAPTIAVEHVIPAASAVSTTTAAPAILAPVEAEEIAPPTHITISASAPVEVVVANAPESVSISTLEPAVAKAVEPVVAPPVATLALVSTEEPAPVKRTEFSASLDPLGLDRELKNSNEVDELNRILSSQLPATTFVSAGIDPAPITPGFDFAKAAGKGARPTPVAISSVITPNPVPTDNRLPAKPKGKCIIL